MNRALMIDDIKLTVADFCAGILTEGETLKIVRYFIREYLPWMPFRAIGEATGCENHTSVIQSINEATKTEGMRTAIRHLKSVFDSKLLGIHKEVRTSTITWYPGRQKKHFRYEAKYY